MSKKTFKTHNAIVHHSKEKGRQPKSALTLAKAGKDDRASAKRGARIDGRKLENDRRVLELHIAKLEGVLSQVEREDPQEKEEWGSMNLFCLQDEWRVFFEKEPPKGIEDPDEFRKEFAKMSHIRREMLLSYHAFLSTHIIASGVVHLSDYLCIQIPSEKKNGKVTRLSLGDLLSLHCDLIEGWGDANDEDSEPGLFGRLLLLAEMLNDVGVKYEVFEDENGLTDPVKYFGKERSTVVKATEETEPEEDEQEPVVSDEELDNARKGKIAVPDLRRRKEDE